MVATDVETRAEAALAARKLSPPQSLGVLGAVIVVVAGFIALCGGRDSSIT